MRYYWIKLPETFFESLKIKKLRQLPAGDTLTIIYLKLLLLTNNSGGKIAFEGIDTNIAKELALQINENEQAVEMGLHALEMVKLLEEKEGDIELTELKNMVGEAKTISPKPSKKSLPENKKKQYGQFNNILLSDNEYTKLIPFYTSEHLLKGKIEDMSLYLKSTGRVYKSHYATLINWGKKDGFGTAIEKKAKKFTKDDWL